MTAKVHIRCALYTGSSGGSASGYNADGRGFAPQTGHPFLDPFSLDGYWTLTGKLNTEKKGTGPPTLLSHWPNIICAATCQSAKLTYTKFPKPYALCVCFHCAS